MREDAGQPGPPPDRSTAGGRRVRFEETLDLDDEAGASRLIGVARLLVLVMIVTTLVSAVLVAGGFVSAVGGIDTVLSIAGAIRAERPRLFLGIAVVGLSIVGYGLFATVGFLLAMGRAFDERVRVRVTDAGVSVRRDGSRYWQSSGVDLPFDAITAVEYADPTGSSTRTELGDWRAPKFLAGRSRSWIRVERDGGPAVYVGSDRPVELAETVARSAPGVESAEPF